MKVTIRHKVIREDDGITSIEVELDGQEIGGGTFGGEPEDNTENRDYSWVTPLVKRLAQKLGADVETVGAEGEDDDL